MSNQYVIDRLAGIQAQLMCVYDSSAPASSASKGWERQAVADEFLRKALPESGRIGSGEIADSHGHRTGQLDIVIEYPFAPSLPVIGGDTRIYLAESVAAIVEVKSNVCDQWDEVLDTAEKVRALKLEYCGMSCSSGIDTTHIPFFAIGFKGWQTVETMLQKVNGSPVDGILVIDGGRYAANFDYYRDLKLEGPGSLLGITSCLLWASQRIVGAGVDVLGYVQDQ